MRAAPYQLGHGLHNLVNFCKIPKSRPHFELSQREILGAENKEKHNN